MAALKATEAQIRAKLRELNPDLFGTGKQPIVEQKTKFLLIGKYNKDAAGNKLAQFTQLSVLSDEAKKANPNLRPSRYFRVTTTDYTKPVTDINEGIRPGRKAWANNIFESQNPELYTEILRLLLLDKKETDPNKKFFEELPDDREGNPVLRLKTPVWGAFIPVQVPGHYVLDAKTGKKLVASARDISTNSFGPARPVIMREMRLFLYGFQFASVEAIAMAQYQKTVEPMLAEEVTYKLNTAGDIVEQKPANNTAGEAIDPENETTETAAPETDAVPLDMP